MVTPNLSSLPTDFIANFRYKHNALRAFAIAPLSDLMQAVLQHISQGVFIADMNFEMIAVNQQFTDILGYPAEAWLGDWGVFDQFKGFATPYQDLFLQSQTRLKHLETVDEYLNFTNHEGKQLSLHLQIYPYLPKVDGAMSHAGYIGLLTDVTTQMSTKKALKKALYFDKLTGLKNREAIDTALVQLLSADATQTSVVVIAVHIDRLYTFNQSIGREATDNLIKLFVERMKALPIIGGQLHTFSRLSGSDFCLLLQVDSLAQVYAYLDKLSQTFELPFVLAGQKIFLRLSLGVAGFPEDAKTGEALLNHAETAVQKARLSGGDSIVWYKDIKQMPDLFSKIHLESALAQGLTRHEFVPFYQPKLNFNQENSDHDSYLFEALVRWQHPDLGLLSPQEFIDTLLDAHLDQRLFENIMQAVIADIRAWQQQGFFVEVSINADVQQLVNPDFLRFMQQVVSQQPDISQHLEIEITEINRIIDEKTTKATLNQLREWGFRVALDDFGTGFASLSYLSNYTFDVVKIDQSFIHDIMQNAKKQQIVKRMIDLAHDLDMQVYAEGVEDFSQHQFLAMVGCDGTQGFLYGKPMSSEATSHWLQMQVSSQLA